VRLGDYPGPAVKKAFRVKPAWLQQQPEIQFIHGVGGYLGQVGRRNIENLTGGSASGLIVLKTPINSKLIQLSSGLIFI
jgi:hypothetical protein